MDYIVIVTGSGCGNSSVLDKFTNGSNFVLINFAQRFTATAVDKDHNCGTDTLLESALIMFKLLSGDNDISFLQVRTVYNDTIVKVAVDFLQREIIAKDLINCHIMTTKVIDSGTIGGTNELLEAVKRYNSISK